MTKKYKLAVYIGRFQGFHKEHAHNIRVAIESAEKVFVFIGGANLASSPHDPFTFDERQLVINKEFPSVNCIPINDYPENDDLWAAQIQKKVADEGYSDSDVTLVGFEKDHTSFYLKMFPGWKSTNVISENPKLSSTDIRNAFFKGYKNLKPLYVNGLISLSTYDFLIDYCFSKIEKYEWLKNEFDYYENYDAIPYMVKGKQPIFCADALVTQSNHILLIRRKHTPGKGLLALPGGHVDLDEHFIDAAVRELRQETKISDRRGELPPGLLKSFIKNPEGCLIDTPNRSLKGRVITSVYHFELPDSTELWKVKGMDDAESATWHSFGSLKDDEFFEDHRSIIRRICKV